MKNSNSNVNMVVVRLIAKNIGTLDIFNPAPLNSGRRIRTVERTCGPKRRSLPKNPTPMLKTNTTPTGNDLVVSAGNEHY